LPDFAIDPQIAADSMPVTELELSAVRLMRNANYPWLLLLPRRAGIFELVDLGPADRIALMEEIAAASAALRETVPCDKLNVASFGNAVRQMHIHVIARTLSDPGWPKPVWGAAPARAYAPGAAEALAAKLAARLK
jgi:diadenosine tetraphosphate (Ap4A) HIT family hydrolase